MGEECVFENDDFTDFNWETNDVIYDKRHKHWFPIILLNIFFLFDFKKSGK